MKLRDTLENNWIYLYLNGTPLLARRAFHVTQALTFTQDSLRSSGVWFGLFKRCALCFRVL